MNYADTFIMWLGCFCYGLLWADLWFEKVTAPRIRARTMRRLNEAADELGWD